MNEARLDFRIVRNGTGPIWVGWDYDLPDTIFVLFHGVINPVPVI